MRHLALALTLCAACGSSSTSDRLQDPENERFLSDPGTGKEDSINFIEEGSYDAEAVLRFVNVADFLDLFEGAGLSQDTAEAIADATKPIATLAELDDIRFVGLIAFHKLKDYALAHEYGPGLGEEYPLPGEDAANANVLDIIKQHVTRAYPSGTQVKRAQHAKAHGCAKALVDVENGDLPAELRRGLFAEDTEFQAWIRFSNGDFAVKPDGDKDVRGMAIKIMNVPGKRVAADLSGTSQDILLINGPNMFVRNALEYADFTRRAHEGNTLSLVTYFLSLNPADWKLRGLENLLSTISKSVRNPLESQYWSTTPYALGGTAMKWSAKPCGGSYAAPGNTGGDNLRAALRASLAAGDACFDLMVQIQKDPRAQPIEDPTVPWAESKTPFVHVARITIPQQEFDSDEQEAFCEKMIMSPWHSIEEHQPLGGINRARLPVYKAMSAMRNMMNGASASEPTSWELR